MSRDWAVMRGAVRPGPSEGHKPMSPWVRWQWSLADRLVFRKIRETLGFDKIQVCVSGSAAVLADMVRFFFRLGLESLEGYGFRQETAPAPLNPPGGGAVGPGGRRV